MPALPVVALLVFWAAHEGGYLPTTWAPSALLVLGLLLAAVVGIGRDRLRLSRPAAIALAALAAYTAWSYLSILWADAPGDALWGSDRTLLFLLLFALFALLPWRTWTAHVALSAFALGIGAVAVVTLLRLDDAGDVVGIFTDGRLTAPVGYVNGAAALFTLGALTAIGLGSRRELPWWLRGPLLAGATAALCTALLCESRGWLFTLPLVALLALALMPGRLRLALWSLLPLAATALATPTLLDVFSRYDEQLDPGAATRALTDAAGDALAITLPLVVVVLVAASALAFLDRRAEVPARVSVGANRGAAALAVVALVATVGRRPRRDRLPPRPRDRRLLGSLRQLPDERPRRLSLRRGRLQPARLLARLARRLPRPPGRRPRTGQLVALLPAPPPQRRAAEVDPQPRAAAAGAHRRHRLPAVRDLPGGRRRGGAARAAPADAARRGRPPRPRSRCCRWSCGRCTARSTGSGRSPR